MAWSLMIVNGTPVPVEGALGTILTTEDDAAAQNVLLRFAHAVGIDPGASNQTKLDGVAAALTEYMITIAREKYIAEESATIQQEAVTNVHW